MGDIRKNEILAIEGKKKSNLQEDNSKAGIKMKAVSEKSSFKV